MHKLHVQNIPPLLVFADDWGRHPSSCQHLIKRLRNDFRVLWVNTIGTRQLKTDSLTLRRGLEKLRNWGGGLKQDCEQMWVIDVPMIPGLNKPSLRWINRQLVSSRLRHVLRRLRMADPIVLTTLPYTNWLLQGLPRRATIYYCTDDYSHWPSADRDTLRKADHDLTAEADLILAASKALFQQHNAAGRCRYFPHGVDYQHFASASESQVPVDLADIPGPRIGFFGLIYEKIDFELLSRIALRFPSVNLVMIGSIAYCPEGFADLPNIHMLGPKLYEELPGYIAGIDVLLLPYVSSDPMIQRSGPLKLNECLASGRPTVSVDVPEVRAMEPHVRVGSGHESFMTLVQEALAEPQDSFAVAVRQAAVQNESWEQRAALLRQYIDELLSIGGSPSYIADTSNR